MNILICDDEQAVGERVLQLTKDFFGSREIPVQCTLCTSGEEALSHREEPFHLALLDVDLDTMSGIALGRELKAQNPELVLVYISAYLEFAPEGYTVHAYRYILKRDLDRMLPRCFECLPQVKILRLRAARRIFFIRSHQIQQGRFLFLNVIILFACRHIPV